MAQRHEKTAVDRLVSYARQRPVSIVGAVFVVAALLLAGVMGFDQARDHGGFRIETGTGFAGDLAADFPAQEGDDSAEGSMQGGSSGNVSAETGTEAPVEAYVIVDVAGAVRTPGVVELVEGSRVRDAIDAAGGLATDADSSAVNRAAPLVDGQQIYIPRKGEVASNPGQAPAATAGAGAPARININNATVDQLDELPGVGPSTAQAIVDERTSNGPFASVEDIMRVSGIGEKKFEKLRNSICV